jgi:predicted nucleic acid-binding protein
MGLATVVHVDTALWERGWALFVARPDKDWGLTDCISFVVMQDRRIMQAFTSDHHFVQAGFKRLMES